jgi:aminocarboxymuconate-semialdehyde decarboxylase
MNVKKEEFRMIIDCHAHLVPPSLIDEIRERASSFPSLSLVQSGDTFGMSFSGGKATRPVTKPLTDVKSRIKWMDEQKVDLQIVGGWLDMFGYELPIEEGGRWARLANKHMIATAKEQTRFVPLATVPLQDGVTAADVLKEAHSQGFKGAMIGTQPKGIGGVLDDPSLDPFWQMADELGSMIFIHPVFECGDNRVHEYGMANAIGRITDTLIAISRIVYSGHVLRYRNIKIIAGIGGAALPYVVGRLRRNYVLDKTLGDPDASLASLYYDTIVQDHRILRFLADIVGVDRIMMGSDMPFPIGDPEPLKIVQAAGFSAFDVASVNGGLAEKLIGDTNIS